MGLDESNLLLIRGKRAMHNPVTECREKGHSLIKNFLTEEQIGSVRKEVDTILDLESNHENPLFFFEVEETGDRRLVRVERIWEALPSLSESEVGMRLIELAESYLNGKVSIFKDKINVRYAGSKGYAPHQDSAAGWDSFGPRFLSIGIFLDKTSPEKGGFEVVDNAHNSGRFENDKGKMTLDLFRTLNPYSIDAVPGDIILLDSEAPHRTFDNISSSDSRHLLITFMIAEEFDIRSKYYEKKIAEFEGDKEKREFVFRVFKFE
jgi:hypothetical protein